MKTNFLPAKHTKAAKKEVDQENISTFRLIRVFRGQNLQFSNSLESRPRLCYSKAKQVKEFDKNGFISGDKFKCARCGQKNEPIGYAPIPTELGQKIGGEMCKDCWAEWLQKQKQLINHFGIDISNPDSHEFLFDQMKIFFYNEGVELAQIDTSKEGNVNW